MGGWGARNPWPIRWGGGQTDFERLWRSLRSALGKGGAGPEDGLEDSWRQAKALGMSMAFSAAERAAVQASPGYATDHVPVYEDLLALPTEATDVERRASIEAAWTAELSAVIPGLGATLAAIDSGITIVAVEESWSTYFQQGRTLEPFTGTPTYGSLNGSAWPNYATAFVLLVRWTGAPNGVPDPETRLVVERVLRDVLPSWCDYTITNGAGFYCDGYNDSYLDLTALGS